MGLKVYDIKHTVQYKNIHNRLEYSNSADNFMKMGYANSKTPAYTKQKHPMDKDKLKERGREKKKYQLVSIYIIRVRALAATLLTTHTYFKEILRKYRSRKDLNRSHIFFSLLSLYSLCILFVSFN